MSRCGLLSIALSSSVGASEDSAVVWYRASDGCPTGTEFIGKLQGRASGARLAEAGDHMDFVVTLVAAERETVGRLERQTQSGAVAIREVRDASCSQVADALALNLTLTLGREAQQQQDPAAEKKSESEVQAEAGEPAASPKEASATPLAPATPVSPAAASDPQSDVVRDASPQTADGARLWTGLQGGALTGVAPDLLARAAVFVHVDDVVPALTEHFALRFAAVGGVGSSSTAAGSVRRWILGGRAEGCPWRWGGASLNLSPCLVFELGASGADVEGSAEGGDANPWAAPGAALRGTVSLARGFRLEAEVGALLPLLREDVYAGPDELYRSGILAFHGGVGFSFGPL